MSASMNQMKKFILLIDVLVVV